MIAITLTVHLIPVEYLLHHRSRRFFYLSRLQVKDHRLPGSFRSRWFYWSSFLIFPRKVSYFEQSKNAIKMILFIWFVVYIIHILELIKFLLDKRSWEVSTSTFFFCWAVLNRRNIQLELIVRSCWALEYSIS